jgi:cyclohexanone monooxygenase
MRRGATLSWHDGGVSADARPDLDAVIVGAGFAGLRVLYGLRQQGLSARVYERGGGVGGTWYWNRYPGARCDVESMEYSYQFSDALQQEWNWSERYAAQPEILRYLEHVASRFDLRRDLRFDTRVDAAVYDEDAGLWTVETSRGERVRARYVVMATGCLSSTHTPRFPGLESFEGAVFHTGAWPHAGVDFGGQRVGVIGTGSSAVQSIPLIAAQAARLFVFQRTATYTIPAHNRPLEPAERSHIKADYAGLRARAAQMPFGLDTRVSSRLALAESEAQRRQEYESRWTHGGLPFLSGYADLLTVKEANDTAAEFVREKIRAIVRDPAVAALLTPSQVLGCKRLCIDTGYYETFNRENVTLVDVSRAPIEALTPHGLRTRDAEYALDAIVFATGFDAMTGALSRIDIRGRRGLALAKKWAEGPRTYLGLASAGFPNLFLVTGPGSPSVLSNMVPSIEQHAGWIARCIGDLRERGLARIEATAEAEDAWVAHVNEVAGATLFPTCNSWYLGANVPGKPRVFMPYLGFPEYVQKCEEVAAKGYAGFAVAP